MFTWSFQQIQRTNTLFKRYLYSQLDWNARLNIIVGMRGVGKTTLILQHAREHLPFDNSVIYISLDDIYFTTNSLIDFAEEFNKRGGKYLLIDEVQKYEGWSREVKMIYDNFPEIQIIASGSSTIEIMKGEGDLSRRAIIYRLQGLSFREFIELKYQQPFPAWKLSEILKSPIEKAFTIVNKGKPVKLFEEYIQAGYYPFAVEDERNFQQRMMQIINTIIETDIPAVNSIDYNAVLKMKKLLGIIAESGPFTPNITKLANQLSRSRETCIKYLQLLAKADIISLMYSSAKGVSALNKPEKIYLNNPNIAYLLADSNANTGNIRETFFMNQLQHIHNVEYPAKGDFLVDETYTFEVGGKNKTMQQIAGIENAYVVADNIEIPVGNKIPLWMFGFLY
jgi:predicted AAA+ superfamily ATPase